MTITTLVQDMYDVLTSGKGSSFSPTLEEQYARQLSARKTPTPEDPIYASEYGDKCLRKLWYKRNATEHEEPLPPYTKFKFMYGDAIEELALCLASDAGHIVEHAQERIVLENSEGKQIMTGRLDAIIDGHVVDVKSMSTFGFNKYKNDGVLREDNDSFGYRWQVAFYHHFAQQNGLAMPDAEPYILGIDKQLGHIQLFPIDNLPSVKDVTKKAATAKKAIMSETPPPRGYVDEPEGASGNMKLGIACSYCSFKNHCWPGLRTFLYSRGPSFLTHVAREPKAIEVTSGGSA